MRWFFLLAGVGSMIVLYGAGPQLALPLAFAVFSANFATFCLQYDDPANRARKRQVSQLAQLTTGGVHSEQYHRVQSTSIKITAEDRQTRYGALTIINLVSGIVSLGLFAWGLALRLS